MSQHVIQQEHALWDCMSCHSRNHSDNSASNLAKQEQGKFLERNSPPAQRPESGFKTHKVHSLLRQMCREPSFPQFVGCNNRWGSHLPSLRGKRLCAVTNALTPSAMPSRTCEQWRNQYNRAVQLLFAHWPCLSAAQGNSVEPFNNTAH